MFVSVKKRNNRHKDNTYNVYISERVRVDGKIMSSDIFLLSLQENEIIDMKYYDKVKNLGVIDNEKSMILEKLKKVRHKIYTEYSKDEAKQKFYEFIPDKDKAELELKTCEARENYIKEVNKSLKLLDENLEYINKISKLEKVIDFFMSCSDTKTIEQASKIKGEIL